jgi:hypothetical protein
MARARSGPVETRGTTTTRNRSRRAVAAVIGPIAATGTPLIRLESPAPRNILANDVTVEEEVNVSRSSRPRRSAPLISLRPARDGTTR